MTDAAHWIAVYWRGHRRYEHPFSSWEDAVAFLAAGADAGNLAHEAVIRPDGTRLDGDNLNAAMEEWQL